jgi:hypothetical protein
MKQKHAHFPISMRSWEEKSSSKRKDHSNSVTSFSIQFNSVLMQCKMSQVGKDIMEREECLGSKGKLRLEMERIRQKKTEIKGEREKWTTWKDREPPPPCPSVTQ